MAEPDESMMYYWGEMEPPILGLSDTYPPILGLGEMTGP